MANGRGPVFVVRPNGSTAGRLSVDMVATLARARANQASACFIRPADAINDALLALVPDDVPVVEAGTWRRARWNVATAARRATERAGDASASVYYELHRELRRHASNHRLPVELRSRLRDTAQRWLARSTEPERRAGAYPRKLLRDRVGVSLPPVLLDEARREAGALGLHLAQAEAGARLDGGPLVALDGRIDSRAFDAPRAYLHAEGYTVVRLGDGSPLLDVCLLLISRFVVCGSPELQQVSYLTNTPSLTLNATDPFTCYPVRNDGLFTLRQAVDLDTGRVLATHDLMSEAYFRNLRNIGHRGNTQAELVAAVQEMHEGVSRGWRDSEGQAQFRQAVVDVGDALALTVPYVAAWAPEGGFVGDGRLARFQADGQR